MKRARPLKPWMRITLLIAFLIALDSLFVFTGLWFTKMWVIGLVINIIAIALSFQWASEYVPNNRKDIYERSVSILFSIIIMLGWELFARVEIISPTWFPPPSRVLKALAEMATEYDKYNKTSLLGRPWLIPEFYREFGWEGVKSLFSESHLWATLFRVFAGFITGAVPGIILGVAMGMSRTIRVMIDPVISALYVVPKITILPLIMLILSPFGEPYKVVTIGIGVFFHVIINSMTGVLQIEPIFIEAGKNYGARGIQLFRHVIWPGALPVIFAGLRLGLGSSLVLCVAIEFLRARSGVGFLTWYYWEILNPPKMYAGLILTMSLGILLTFGLFKIGDLVMPWQKRRAQRAVIDLSEG